MQGEDTLYRCEAAKFRCDSIFTVELYNGEYKAVLFNPEPTVVDYEIDDDGTEVIEDDMTFGVSQIPAMIAATGFPIFNRESKLEGKCPQCQDPFSIEGSVFNCRIFRHGKQRDITVVPIEDAVVGSEYQIRLVEEIGSLKSGQIIPAILLNGSFQISIDGNTSYVLHGQAQVVQFSNIKKLDFEYSQEECESMMKEGRIYGGCCEFIQVYEYNDVLFAICCDSPGT